MENLNDTIDSRKYTSIFEFWKKCQMERTFLDVIKFDEKDILLKEEAVAMLLSVSLSFLRNSRLHGSKGPDYVRLEGRMIRYKLSAVRHYIQENTVTMKYEEEK
jgi:hypothetical protein